MMTKGEKMLLRRAINRFVDDDDSGWHDGMMMLHRLLNPYDSEVIKASIENEATGSNRKAADADDDE